MKSAWEAVKSSIKPHISDHAYRMWVDPIRCGEATPNRMVLSCPNHFSKKWILDHYGPLLIAEVHKAVSDKCELFFEVSIGVKGPKRKVTDDRQISLPRMNTQPHNGHFLRQDFTFDQFVVGESNGFAYSASLAFATRKKNKPNALFLLSKTGLGKSHLSQAVGHQILAKCPSDRVYYITADEFANEMIQAFKTNSIGAFKDKYRNRCDVLLLEDVHYLSGKEQTQVELALTLDSLLGAQKRIIFSSCYLPAEIPKLNDKLRSRFTCGLISTIETPDFQTRVRILQKRDKLNGYNVPQDVIHYLAGELTENIRLLKNGLENTTTKASLMGIPVDLALAEGVVQNIARHRQSITIDVIKKLVCKYFRITAKEIVSPSRKQSIVKPRQVAIYLARHYTQQPLHAIGKSFNRYHATALHSIGTVERELKGNGLIRKQVEYFCQKLDAGDY